MKQIKKITKALPEDIWVDVHNDKVMVDLGFRKPELSPRDPSVWTKTPYEKSILRKAKHSNKESNSHFHSVPLKFIPVRDRLIIYLKRNKTFDKTTYSTECWQHEIPFIVSNYCRTKKDNAVENLVVKYSWNGKIYKPNELPFWR